jgi:hypothetical protein
VRQRFPWEDASRGGSVEDPLPDGAAKGAACPVAVPEWQGGPSGTPAGERPGYREAMARLVEHTIRHSRGIDPAVAVEKVRGAAQRFDRRQG